MDRPWPLDNPVAGRDGAAVTGLDGADEPRLVVGRTAVDGNRPGLHRVGERAGLDVGDLRSGMTVLSERRVRRDRDPRETERAALRARWVDHLGERLADGLG